MPVIKCSAPFGREMPVQDSRAKTTQKVRQNGALLRERLCSTISLVGTLIWRLDRDEGTWGDACWSPRLYRRHSIYPPSPQPRRNPAPGGGFDVRLYTNRQCLMLPLLQPRQLPAMRLLFLALAQAKPRHLRPDAAERPADLLLRLQVQMPAA
jgi:hypothetical protein